MLISFVIPVYNNSGPFGDCLLSLSPMLMGGTAEAVVVDDGSTDDEARRLDEIVARYEKSETVTLVRIAHSGAAAARNAALNYAKGEYVWFVDADDTILSAYAFPLVDDLRSMPPSVSFFHIGDMLTIDTPDGVPPNISPQASLTSQCLPLQLVFPRGSVADHTTNIIRRQWLEEHQDIRYPEDMQLLEDTVFALRVVEAATLCCYNSSYRLYVRHTYHSSLTAGAWSAQRSSCFTMDICRFFRFLKEYVGRHGDYVDVRRFYERYRYVYLRVMAVKGCPWNDICQLTDVVGAVRCHQRPFYRLLAFLCKILRRKR